MSENSSIGNSIGNITKHIMGLEMDNAKLKQHNASLIQQLDDMHKTTATISTQTFPQNEHKNNASSRANAHSSPHPSASSSRQHEPQKESSSSPGNSPTVPGFIIHPSKNFFVPITLDESKYGAVKELPDDSVSFPIQVNVVTPPMF